MATDTKADETFAITTMAMLIIARTQQVYGPYFASRVWERAEQIARAAERDCIEPDDVKAALYELL